MSNNEELKYLENKINEIKNTILSRKGTKSKLDLTENDRIGKNIYDNYYSYPYMSAIEINKSAIILALSGEFQQAIGQFELAIDYFPYPALYYNAAKCYSLAGMVKESHLLMEKLGQKESPLNHYFHSCFNEKAAAFFTPVYLDLDREENDRKEPIGYNFLLEKETKDSKVIIYNVPIVVWREFINEFIKLEENNQMLLDTYNIEEDFTLLYYETQIKYSLTEEKDLSIPLFPVLEAKCKDGEFILIKDLYKHFILESYLKLYIDDYIRDSVSEIETKEDYFSYHRYNEEIYGLLHGAKYNLLENKKDPFRDVSNVEYFRAISEFRSHFPAFKKEETLLFRYQNSEVPSLLESLNSFILREDLNKEMTFCLENIIDKPNSVASHARKALEILLKHTLTRENVNIKSSDGKQDLPLYRLIPIVYKLMETRESNLKHPVSDLYARTHLSTWYNKNSKPTETKIQMNNLRKSANDIIHYSLDKRNISMKQLSSKEAMVLFEILLKSIAVIQEKFKL